MYDVDPLRDGRSFVTRRVVARQHGRPIYFQTASYQKPEEGFEHQDAMPDVSPPEECPTWASSSAGGRRSGPTSGSGSGRRSTCAGPATRGPDGELDASVHPAQARLWIRVNGDLPDDRILHRAAFTYASDMTLLGATLVPHGVHVGVTEGAVGLARPHDLVPPAVPRRRVVALRPALALGLGWPRPGVRPGVHRRTARLVATVAQEGLIRPARSPGVWLMTSVGELPACSSFRRAPRAGKRGYGRVLL